MAAYRDETEAGITYPAERFAVNLTFCPGCRQAVPGSVEQCPKCGYSGADAVEKFPFEAPVIERFMDPDQHLPVEDCQRIDVELAALGESYPQVRFCFCIVDLAEETDPREFGFWLLNASPVRGPVEERLRPWTVLLLVDHAGCRVSITSGYAIEPFLNEESMRAVVRLEERFFREGDYGAAILRFVRGMRNVLLESEKRVRDEMEGRTRRKRRGESGW